MAGELLLGPAADRPRPRRQGFFVLSRPLACTPFPTVAPIVPLYELLLPGLMLPEQLSRSLL
jgi:hypothetical protein